MATDQSNPRAQPYALEAGEGWTYRFGIDFTVKASEVQTGSGLAMVEYTTRQGEEPPDHTHPTEDEIFYVLDGALTFHCGGKRMDVETGATVFLPCGIEHGYTIRSKTPVRLLAVTAPIRNGISGGWGGFVSDMELGQGDLIATPASPII